MANELDLWRGGRLSPRTLSRFFDDLWSPADMMGLNELAFSPQYDIEETDDYFLFNVDLPGVNTENINIEVTGGNLVISGERQEEIKEGGRRGRRLVERRYGRFQSVFALPSAVDTQNIEATYDNGVLKVAVPKREEAKPQSIKIGQGKAGIFSKIASKVQDVKEQVTSKSSKQKDTTGGTTTPTT